MRKKTHPRIIMTTIMIIIFLYIVNCGSSTVGRLNPRFPAITAPNPLPSVGLRSTGFSLGSFYASPTGLFSASYSGNILIDINTQPEVASIAFGLRKGSQTFLSSNSPCLFKIRTVSLMLRVHSPMDSEPTKSTS